MKFILILFVGISTSALMLAQVRPTLGTTASYGAFTGVGGVTNTGLTQLTGDIGTNAGQFTGFPPGIYTGAKHVADPPSLVAKNDLTTAWNQMGAIPCDAVLGVTMGNGQVLTAKTYCVGPASTISGNLTFDAQGNPNAIFIVKVGGALNVATTSNIILANLAQAGNIYWRVDGAVSILDNSNFKGTIVANGAIHLYGGTTLEGRALATVGAITMASNVMSVPVIAPSVLTVVRPAAGDTIIAGTQNYQIVYTGVNVTLRKTLEYTLDGGTTWNLIGVVRNTATAYSWNVPSMASNRAFIRITDSNGVRGTSGMFVIVPSGSITVTRPAAGDSLIAGTPNYQIGFSGPNITPRKTFAYSLDSGTTWIPIGTVSNNATSFSWNVPVTPSNRALIRITDSNGLVGKSGMFRIVTPTTPVGSITVTRPAAGDSLIAGTPNYQIGFSGTNITPQKTFAYSLDSGTTWIPIGTVSNNATSFSWNVPVTPSNRALIRITDSNGLVGKSGMFRIVTSTTPVGSITVVRPAAGDTLIAGTQNYQIAYVGVNLAPRKTFEYSLDSGATWNTIGVDRSSAAVYSWNVPTTPSTRALVRITDSNGVTGTSGMFTIKMNSSSNGSINSLTLGGVVNNRIGNGMPMEISWTFTPDIGTSANVEYSLDNKSTWTPIGTVPTSEQPRIMWTTPSSGTYDAAFIRVKSTLGMERTSEVFRIGAIASVADRGSVDGFSIGNFPNPVNGSTTIRFLLPVRSFVKVAVTDGLGREIGTVAWRSFEAGSHSIPFNASQLPSGIYTYTMEVGKVRVMGMMTIVR